MKRLLLTISGPDKPGIIAEASGLLFRKRCNLEDISMTLLEGQFAMMMTLSVPGRLKPADLAKAFSPLRKEPWGMEFFLTGLKGKAVRGKDRSRHCQSCVITAFGRDRTGIVHGVSRALAAQGINITDLDSRILGTGRQATYAMLLEVDVPDRTGLTKLRRSLARVANSLKIEIQVRPQETLSL